MIKQISLDILLIKSLQDVCCIIFNERIYILNLGIMPFLSVKMMNEWTFTLNSLSMITAKANTILMTAKANTISQCTYNMDQYKPNQMTVNQKI